MNALTHEDKGFVLGYLSTFVPDAFDLAIAALASRLAAAATTPQLPFDQGESPDPV
jgi:hypothetical protein